MKRVEEFYKESYASNITVHPINISQGNTTQPEVTTDEVISAIKKKAARKDLRSGSMDVMKDAGMEGQSRLTHLFPQCIHQERLLALWCSAIIILLHKKGD